MPKKRMRNLVASIVLLAALVVSVSVIAGTKGPEVTLYANITAVQPVVTAFTEIFGIPASYTRISSSKILATVMSEFDAGKLQADVLQAPMPIMQYFKEKGVLAPYASPVAAGYPDWAKGADGVIYSFGIECMGILYNTDLVNSADAPQHYADLADPKWDGKIVMPDPSVHSSTISWLVGLKEKVFEDEGTWMTFLEGLAANHPMFVRSLGPTPGPIASGEKAIGISMQKYIITKAPAPLDWACQGEPQLGSPRGIAVTSTTANPEAARLFINYWLSKTAMEQVASEVGESVVYPGVFPPIEGMDATEVIPVRVLSDEEIQHWGGVFKDIFNIP